MPQIAASVIRQEGITTAKRDSLTVTSGEFWKIYNTTTAQWEYWNGSAWVALDTSSSGDVTAGANLGDNLLIRGDGATKGVQNSGILVDDSDNLSGIGNISLSGTVDGIDIATDVAANTAKATNVSTELSVGTVGTDTVAITSDGGADDVTLPAAIVSAAGMLTTAKWAEIVANNAKDTNVSTDLTAGTKTATTIDVNSSDGTNATLVEANTDDAGLLGADKWDEIVANTSAKHTQGTDTSLGSGAVAEDHGTAATDQIVNVSYGTGSPPTASTTTEGSLFIKYDA